MISICHRTELGKAPLYAGRTKLGSVWYCSKCLTITYYEGRFCWDSWSMKRGPHGFGAYYEAKKNKSIPSSDPIVQSHGLIRKERLAANAYLDE